MTFDFFNSSRLAFGNKLTNAFRQLEELMNSADENLAQIYEISANYDKYIGKNYNVPEPTRPAMAARTGTLYKMLRKILPLKQINYSGGKVSFDIIIQDASTGRITHATASNVTPSTSVRYVFLTPSLNNNDINQTARISSSAKVQNSREKLMFAFRLDGNRDIVCLSGDIYSTLGLYPYLHGHYNSLTKSSNLSIPYTAQNYECVCAVGNLNDIDVKLNGTSIIASKNGLGNGYKNINNCILYLKPGDKVTGTINRMFRVNYNLFSGIYK